MHYLVAQETFFLMVPFLNALRSQVIKSTAEKSSESDFFEAQKTIFPLSNLIHVNNGHQKLRDITFHASDHFEVSHGEIDQLLLCEVLCAKNAAPRAL